jgi:subtilisin family serine protease
VSFRESPVAGYRGGLTGLPATRAQGKQRFDGGSAAARRYSAHLEAAQDGVLRTAGVDPAKRVYRYTTVDNAVALPLTAAQAARLRRTPGVTGVVPNQTFTIDTVSTPAFLGLSGAGGAWQRQFGGAGQAGAGMIVGVIDTGIWPESPSFAPLPEPRPDQAVIDGKWRGACEAGRDARAGGGVSCNNKLIGARWFGRARPSTVLPAEYESPRDLHGHGTHTAGTAAGNGGVEAAIAGQPVGAVSGVAPAARIASYKAMWAQPGGAAGTAADLVAAVEAAVLDGVDVLNYSITGISYTTNYPVGAAFFNAAQAGVFLAASAGNNGTLGASQVNHNVPWVTTVAATSHDRGYRATVRLGDGKAVTGTGVGGAVPSTRLVESSSAGRPGADPAKVRLCYDEDVLDPAKVAGSIVLCARGGNGRTAKSAAVARAGGAGMVLYNTDPAADDVSPDYHAVPTVHVTVADGTAILKYAQAGEPTAALDRSERYQTSAPHVATFSSYGPAAAGRGDLLKPDLAAPGVDIIAAVAPPGNGGERFASFSGTSMSSPQIAGIAALLKARHPEWSPMAVKSALMTTAAQTDRAGGPMMRAGVPATPIHYGAGHVEPPRAFDPGLVYDNDSEDWLAYQCAVGDLTPEACVDVPTVDPSDLNYPSIAVGDLVGTQTVVRTVTNTTRQAAVYRAAVQNPPGTTMTVKPAMLSIAPGQSQTFRVTVSRVDAAVGAFTFGAINWTDRVGHAVRSPVAVRPVVISVPPRVVGTGTSGTAQVKVRPGYDGATQNTSTGVIPAVVTPVALSDPTGIPFDQFLPFENSHTKKVELTVPAGTRMFALGLFDADLPPGTNADFHVYQWTTDATGQQVRRYLGGTVRPDSEEQVELYSPAAGRYDIYVDLYALPAGLSSATVRLHSWTLGATAAPVSVSPADTSVREGVAYPVTVGWSDLPAGTRHLGVLLYRNGTALIARSVLRIDT